MKHLYFIFTLFIVLFFTPQTQAASELSSIRGVSLPSLEWACVQYNGVYDFPLKETAAILKKWNVNTVRLPLNQDCWLDNAKYRKEVKAVVDYFSKEGFSSIIDLHWNKPEKKSKLGQQVMADAKRSPEFWKSAALAFKANPKVIAFELYNEPHSISWDCWKAGCTTKEGWQAAGMNSLVQAVRSTGAKQWVIVNGLGWGNDVIGAAARLPVDPENKIALGWHVYDEFDDKSKCTTPNCFESKIAPLAKQYPIVITEFGSRLHCNPNHDKGVMEFAARNGIGLVGWAWYPSDCGFPALIKDWSGTPTAAGYQLCAFLKGNCVPAKAPVAAAPAKKPVIAALPTPVKKPAGAKNVCTVYLDRGVVTAQSVVCSSKLTLTISGAKTQTWNNRISSWKTEGDWTAATNWDYYTTQGRAEKGSEVWAANSLKNVSTAANDRTRVLVLYPGKSGSLTIYEDGAGKGALLKISNQTGTSATVPAQTGTVLAN
jgi:hypothetical protein